MIEELPTDILLYILSFVLCDSYYYLSDVFRVCEKWKKLLSNVNTLTHLGLCWKSSDWCSHISYYNDRYIEDNTVKFLLPILKVDTSDYWHCYKSKRRLWNDGLPLPVYNRINFSSYSLHNEETFLIYVGSRGFPWSANDKFDCKNCQHFGKRFYVNLFSFWGSVITVDHKDVLDTLIKRAYPFRCLKKLLATLQRYGIYSEEELTNICVESVFYLLFLPNDHVAACKKYWKWFEKLYATASLESVRYFFCRVNNHTCGRNNILNFQKLKDITAKYDHIHPLKDLCYRSDQV